MQPGLAVQLEQLRWVVPARGLELLLEAQLGLLSPRKHAQQQMAWRQPGQQVELRRWLGVFPGQAELLAERPQPGQPAAWQR